jgi:hypothetical protein
MTGKGFGIHDPLLQRVDRFDMTVLSVTVHTAAESTPMMESVPHTDCYG